MNTSEQVLVIILSSFLALFLLLGIIAFIKFIQILNHLKSLTQRAEEIATHVEEMSESMANFGFWSSMLRVFGRAVQAFQERDNKTSRKKRR